MGHFPTATRRDVLDCLFGQVEELMAVEFSKQVDWDGAPRGGLQGFGDNEAENPEQQQI